MTPPKCWIECECTRKKRGACAPLEVCCGSFAELELYAEGELELTGSAIVALTAAAAFSADRTDRLDVATWIARSNVIEHVEGIHAELDFSSFRQLEILQDRSVPKKYPRTAIAKDADVA